MERVLLSLSYQNGARLKKMRRSEFPEKLTNKHFEKVIPLTLPIDTGYTQEYVERLSVKLTDDYKKGFDSNVKLVRIDEVWITLGYLGFMNIELYCHLSEEIKLDVLLEKFEMEMTILAENVSRKCELYDTVICDLSDYVSQETTFYYGRHMTLVKSHRDRHSVGMEGINRYVFSYHIFTDSSQFARKVRKKLCMQDKNVKIDNATTWMQFGFHLWLVKADIVVELIRKLSNSVLVAAWEVLIYDTGAKNYNLFLQSVVSDGFTKSNDIRETINHDNIILTEISLLLPDQRHSEMEKILQCREEYQYDYRRECFEKSREHLQYATGGIETNKQSKSSRIVQIILTFLTSMSMYSVVLDGYSLITADAESISLFSLSSLLFSVATLLMVVFSLCVLHNRD